MCSDRQSWSQSVKETTTVAPPYVFPDVLWLYGVKVCPVTRYCRTFGNQLIVGWSDFTCVDFSRHDTLWSALVGDVLLPRHVLKTDLCCSFRFQVLRCNLQVDRDNLDSLGTSTRWADCALHAPFAQPFPKLHTLNFYSMRKCRWLVHPLQGLNV